jgi:DNA repair exonuclease SbcCD nuclease subunit
MRSVLARACDLAREKEVDLFLVPGDLFDDEAVSMDSINSTMEALGGLDPMPVVVAPGNHDFYSLGSPYNDEFLVARRQKPWPRNVKVFRTGMWEIWRAPGEISLAVTGMAHAAGAAIGDRLIAEPIPRDDSAEFKVLVFHGSRDNTDLPRGKLKTLPFSDAELAGQGFDYAAVGHYHDFALMRDPAQRVIGAYSGCPFSRGLDELGKKGVILGEISKDPSAEEAAEVRLERVPLDHRRIHLLQLDCTGLTYKDAILKRAEEQISLRECAEEDIVCLRLFGRMAPGIDLRVPEGFLSDRFFHAVVDVSRLRPAYDLDRYKREELKTTEARFAREMLRRIDEASDPSERRLLENALFYGLDALVQKEVAPRYED